MRKAFLTGRLGNDPGTFSPEGSEFTCLQFSIANNDERKKNGEEWESLTSWFDIEFWTKSPAKWIKKLIKGKLISVAANPRQSTWQTEDGHKRSRIVFVVSKGTFPQIIETDQKPSENHNPSSSPEPFEDDIPF